jgi:RHS repeat-associated protein
LGRVVDQRWLHPTDGSPIDRFQYGYDRDGNRLYRDNRVNPSFGELYHASGVVDTYDAQGHLLTTGYDRLNQLTDFARGTLTGTKDSLVGAASHRQSWTLDALGNWTKVTTDGLDQNRSHNAQNQRTAIAGLTTPFYDNNGNTTTDERSQTYVYDAWNRLVQVTAGSTTVVYGSDALGRRIRTTVNSNPATDLYYSSAWQVVEEQVGGAMTAQYLWSPVYVDALIERDTSGGPRLYVQQDANWNVTAVVDTLGNVQERYIYDPYGQPTVLDPNSWASRVNSLFGWIYLHQGGRYDNATGLYNFRRRDESPTLGRWMQEDPLTYSTGNNNLYDYLSSDPTSRLDSFGLKDCCGVDITPNLERGLKMLETEFGKKSTDDKLTICMRVLSNKKEMPFAWDILSLIGKHPEEELTKGSCGRGDCKNTVTVKGTCQWAPAVNYILFGKMSRIGKDANLSQSVYFLGFHVNDRPAFPTLDFDYLVKMIALHRSVKSHTDGGGMDDQIAWARVGWTGRAIASKRQDNS